MAWIANRVKGKGSLSFMVAAVLACSVFWVPANASNSPWLDKAIDHLNQAENATDEATQSDLLNSAIADLQRAKSKREEKGEAIALIQSALSDLKAGDSSKISDDITQAIADVREAIPGSDKTTEAEKASASTNQPPASPDQSPAAPEPPLAPPDAPPSAPAAGVPVAGQPWENSLGMKFVPAGTDGVLFSIWDTRVKDFQAFFDATGYDATAGMFSMTSDGWKQRGDNWKSPGFTQTDDDPVVGMNREDALAFCQWLTKKERAEGKLGPDQEYRLPTDAEWNAAMGPTTYPWGNDWPPPDGAGNYAGKEAVDGKWQEGKPTLDGYADGYPRTSPVGSFKPNAYGLYDMGGNVSQWCEDKAGSTLRGASWCQATSKNLVSSFEYRPISDTRSTNLGFRVVLVVPSPKAPAPPTTAGTPTSATPPPVPQAAPTVALTADQTRAVVLIKGDNAEGTGFLVKSADGPGVVTNLHVISDNPNLKITTTSGSQITVLSLKGATDRDLAMFAIKDQNYSYLPLPADISLVVQPGDEVVTPGNSADGEVMLNTLSKGKLLGIGPERIEFDNPIYHGNSGGPVLHLKSGQVLGVITEAMKAVPSDDLATTSLASRNSAVAGSMRYFGLRIDTVPKWEPYDPPRFQNETAFLDQFDKRSRSLDSYLNGAEDKTENATLYVTDEKIATANKNFFKQAATGDASQRADALTGLLADLNDIANADMDAIQDLNSFYTFDQQRAKDESGYRKALKKELDDIGASDVRLSNLPRKN